mmetsp:Transcript_44097/g.127278  ORF Transcript_44097/g.127278 Transcript_44097/m.127278 type:complete len:288 (-) Transcript_44097:130-993(-)
MTFEATRFAASHLLADNGPNLAVSASFKSRSRTLSKSTERMKLRTKPRTSFMGTPTSLPCSLPEPCSSPSLSPSPAGASASGSASVAGSSASTASSPTASPSSASRSRSPAIASSPSSSGCASACCRASKAFSAILLARISAFGVMFWKVSSKALFKSLRRVVAKSELSTNAVTKVRSSAFIGPTRPSPSSSSLASSSSAAAPPLPRPSRPLPRPLPLKNRNFRSCASWRWIRYSSMSTVSSVVGGSPVSSRMMRIASSCFSPVGGMSICFSMPLSSPTVVCTRALY